MKASCISDEYETGVEQFLQFVERNAPVIGGKYLCLVLNVGIGDDSQ